MEEAKKKITFWKIIKWTLLGASILVYLVVFIRLFAACDAKISDDIILTADEKAAFENFDADYPLYHYQPTSWTNDEGDIQIKNIYYIEPISEIQLTLSYRMSVYGEQSPFAFDVRVVENDESFTAPDDDTPVYREDLPGESVELEEYIENRYDHRYFRLCASGITVDNGTTRSERVQTVDEDGNVTYSTKTVIDGGNKIYLDIYDEESGELLYSFLVAGKGVGNARIRRNKVDVKITE